MNVGLQIAVDFTASNGNYSDPDSLHYFDPTNQQVTKNPYQKCMEAAIDVLLHHDRDNQVPLWGFGGIPRKGPQSELRKVSHCFALNFLDESPEVEGKEGILAAYQNALRFTKLNGPTLFAPVLHKVLEDCKEKMVEEPNYYCFFLVLTDGWINDFQDTADLLVEACNYPISIMIVGVGEDDFEQMNDLDDFKFKNRDGLSPNRDICNFVKFK